MCSAGLFEICDENHKWAAKNLLQTSQIVHVHKHVVGLVSKFTTPITGSESNSWFGYANRQMVVTQIPRTPAHQGGRPSGRSFMKNGMESTAVGRAPEAEGFTSRKLIRPALREGNRSEGGERRERALTSSSAGNGAGTATSKKTPPPEQTHAENFYYQKQMQSKTPMVVVTHDGEELHGIIEWYDRTCIKLNRNAGSPNLLVYKSCIKYMFKEGEQNGRK